MFFDRSAYWWKLMLCLWILYLRITFWSHSEGVVDAVGLGAQGNSGLIAADIERSSFILCGEASADTSGIKEALAALSGPIIASRGGIPLLAR